MLSSRPYYSSDVEFYRQSDRGFTSSIDGSASHTDSYSTNTLRGSRDTQESEVDSKGVPAPRKRVPIACDRCRKRKIKCSGEDGGNRGCSNCINAGYPGCRFLRVQSVQVDASTLIPRHMVYPRTFHGTHRYLPYSIPTGHRPSYTSSPQVYTPPATTYYTNGQSNLEYSNFPSGAANVSWPRAQGYQSPYNDDCASPYATQPPSYMLPHTDPMSGAPSSASTHLTRSTAATSWVDATNPGVSTAHGMPIASYNYQNTDEPQFQTLATQQLVGSGVDRTLPTPALSRLYPSAPVSTLESLPLSAMSYRSSNGWHTDTASTTSHHSSLTSCSDGHFTDAERMRSVCGPSESEFCYMNLQNGPHLVSQDGMTYNSSRSAPLESAVGQGNRQKLTDETTFQVLTSSPHSSQREPERSSANILPSQDIQQLSSTELVTEEPSAGQVHHAGRGPEGLVGRSAADTHSTQRQSTRPLSATTKQTRGD